MNIVVIGSEEQMQECVIKFGTHQCWPIKEWKFSNDIHSIFFVFDHDRWPKKATGGIAVFADTTSRTLRDIRDRYFSDISAPVFGFAGLAGFLNRPVLEVCISPETEKSMLTEICKRLGTEFEIVSDQVGMFTPRVVAMIINEAYFAAEDATASREDIDKAMKTGTNYPWGPFAWGEKIGLRNVVAILTALHGKNADGRYEICATLKAESMNSARS